MNSRCIVFFALVLLTGCGAAHFVGTSANSGSLSASPGIVSFGSVTVGQTASSTISLLNTSSTSVDVTKISMAGSSFSAVTTSDFPLTINAGSTYQFNVNFTPQASGTATGLLTITSDATKSSTITIGVNGTGVTSSSTGALSAFVCASSSIYGIGSTVCTVTLSAAAPNDGTIVAITSNNTAIATPGTVTVLAGATSASFTVTASSVNTSQAVMLTASAGNTAQSFSIELYPVSASISINPSSLSFGDVALNSSAIQLITLTSAGTQPVTVNDVALSGTEFTVSGIATPLTLNQGQSASLSVAFAPTAEGTTTGTLTIVSTASNIPTASIPLTGNGVAHYVVDLTWSSPINTTDPIAGYYVLRTISGTNSYQAVNSSPISSTSFTDSTVQNGNTYDYVVESVDSSGITSDPSNTTTLVIP